MIRKLRGTNVVITGATSGIGRATALEFVKSGARVVVAGRREERLRELVSEIEAKGGEALAVQSDVADQAQVENLIAKSVERFGRIDTLVNNAGVGIAAENNSVCRFAATTDIHLNSSRRSVASLR